VRDIATLMGRSELQVEIAWALQRGLAVVPQTVYPAREVRRRAAAF
jgi:hypothetical protein